MGKKVKKESEVPANDVFDPLNIESKNAKTAVLMLEAPENDVILKACEALYRFGEKCEENRLQILQFGGLEPLHKLVKHEDKGIHRNAMMAFGVLSCHLEVRKAMRKLDCIKTIVKLLDPEQEETITHEFASLFCASWALEYTGKIELLEKNAIEPLVVLLTSTDPDVQKNCIESIGLLLHDYQSRQQVRHSEGLQPILDLIKSEYPIIQQIALECLTKLSTDVENRDALRDLDALDSLLSFLSKKEWADQHVNALTVLSNMFLDVETLDQLAESNDVKKFYEIITSEESLSEVKVYACMAIGRAARNEDIRRVMHEQEMEKVLINLVTDGEDAQTKAAAARALSQLAESVVCKDTISRLEGIGPLVTMLKSNNEEVRDSASLCLANLTAESPYSCNEVYEKNGIDHLINLMSEPNRESTQANAAACLTNLASDEVIRSTCQSLVIIQALVKPLQSGSSVVQAKALQCLSAFLYNYSSRKESQDVVLGIVVNHLSSGNAEVRRNAAWALCVAAADIETTAEICKLGAIRLLADINASGTRRNQFSELAIERIFEQNLPAKYSYTGEIAYQNVLPDLFYDCGLISSNSTFPSIEDLLKNQVNEKRETLIVNLRSQDDAQSLKSGDGGKRKTPTNLLKGTSQAARDRARAMKKQQKEVIDESEETEEERPIPEDPKLEAFLKETIKNISALKNEEDQVVELAIAVSNKMGGQKTKEEISKFTYEHHIATLKIEIDSNVIPLGIIKDGTYYHRSLLFKVLADRLGIPCTLQRGQYNKGWNVVMMKRSGQTLPFLVDLIHSPGELYSLNSVKSVTYQKI